jgi:orotate phosphoribosyltransferase
MDDQEKIINWLFATRALQVAPSDQPFWYTSGLFGPYYINTHYLYGSKAAAEDLLGLIDQGEPQQLPGLLKDQVMQQYEKDPIYRQLMDMLLARLAPFEFDIISGGARRDYFFSISAACLLEKPHLSLQKDKSAVYTKANGWQNSMLAGEGSLAGRTVFHLADLVTEASSYTRAWLPAIRRLGAGISQTLAVVDRNQNGRQILAKEAVSLHSLVRIDTSLFDKAAGAGLIDSGQKEQLIRFSNDPKAYISSFLSDRPAFIKEQISLGGQAKERAERFMQLGLQDRG